MPIFKNKDQVTEYIEKLIELKVIIIVGYYPYSFLPIYRMSKEHMTKIIAGNKDEIALLKKFNISITPRLLSDYQERLSDPDYYKIKIIV